MQREGSDAHCSGGGEVKGGGGVKGCEGFTKGKGGTGDDWD